MMNRIFQFFENLVFELWGVFSLKPEIHSEIYFIWN